MATLQVKPTHVQFRDRPLGTSTSMRVVASNETASSITIGPVNIAPSGSGFNLDGNHCSGMTLRAGKQCVVSVAFGPSNAGAASAVLTYKTPAGATLGTVTLNGRGTTSSGPTGTTGSTTGGHHRHPRQYRKHWHHRHHRHHDRHDQQTGTTGHDRHRLAQTGSPSAGPAQPARPAPPAPPARPARPDDQDGLPKKAPPQRLTNSRTSEKKKASNDDQQRAGR